jgi:hypothetical protein
MCPSIGPDYPSCLSRNGKAIFRDKKIFPKDGMLLAPKQGPFFHHVFDAFHHVLTIKLPPSNRRYFQNTP